MDDGYPQKISIIIPVFNESNRINQGLKIINQWRQKFPHWEFILINDGSTDDTAIRIKKYKFIKLISYNKNKGKGFALKQGVMKATQPLILLTDIDWSTPLSELPKLFKQTADFEVVIGSRKIAGAQIQKHQPWWREWLGRQFTNLSRLWLGLNISDFTCGFKLLKTEPAKKLFSLSKINRWGYDAEILYLAKKLHYRVTEAPVVWRNDNKTKVNLFKDIFRSLTDLFLIRLYYG